ncbi:MULTISPECIES: hypothetical protein [Streptacidiphilus]|uniref:ABC transporter permease n=1 Tax=Streptacidiphilus cavernicola TaxID=3342716 RepID=A0ABV6ULM0_9ACTN|nr:hypothetical protein [Streptacidiphilus jeojiense]
MRAVRLRREGPGDGTPRRGPARPASLRLLRREARGDAPLLACLAVLVAVFTGLCALGPVELGGKEDQALRQRLAAAADAGAVLTVSAPVELPQPGLGAPNPPALRTQLESGGQSVVSTAGRTLGTALRPVRTTVDYQLLGIDSPLPVDPRVTQESVTLHHISDAPAYLHYVQGAAPADSTPAGELPGIALSTGEAKLLGLGLGQQVELWFQATRSSPRYEVLVRLVGIYRPEQEQSEFWRQLPGLDKPLEYPGQLAGTLNIAVQGLVGADAPELLAKQGIPLPTVGWEYRVALGDAAVKQLPALAADTRNLAIDLNDLLCTDSPATGDSPCSIGAHPSGSYVVDDGLTPVLTAFTGADAQTRALAGFAVASLAAVGLATVLVSVRLLLRRRAVHLRLQRSRGASATGLVLQRSLVTAPVLLLAGELGWRLGLLPAPTGTSGSPQPVAALLGTAAALLLVPLLTWYAVREPGRAREVRRRASRRTRRLVLEATALVLCVGGVVALRVRGSGGGAGIDVQLSLVPVLVALVAVLLLVRLYPLVLGLLAGRSRRGGGVVAFLGLRGAARDAGGTSLALFVLVITLGTAVFGGMVSRSVYDGAAVGAAWTAGADVSLVQQGDVAPTPVAAGGSSPVRATVAEYLRTVLLTGDEDGANLPQTALITVDPAQLAAADPDGPLARALGVLHGGKPVATGTASATAPVLADPGLIVAENGESLRAVVDSALGSSRTALHLKPVGALTPALRQDPVLGPLVAGLPADTPVIVGTTALEPLLPAQQTGGTALLLFARPGAAPAAVAAAAADALGPQAQVRVRAEVLGTLRGDGLVRIVDDVYTVCSLLAVVFGLLAVALELVLTARERGRTSSYLRTLGLAGRQAAVLQVLQLVPLAVAAAAGGVLVGVLEPRLLGPALSISQFTGGPAAPALHTDYLLTALLGAGLAALVVCAAVVESTVLRMRRLGGVLRLGEA